MEKDVDEEVLGAVEDEEVVAVEVINGAEEDEVVDVSVQADLNGVDKGVGAEHPANDFLFESYKHDMVIIMKINIVTV